MSRFDEWWILLESHVGPRDNLILVAPVLIGPVMCTPEVPAGEQASPSAPEVATGERVPPLSPEVAAGEQAPPRAPEVAAGEQAPPCAPEVTASAPEAAWKEPRPRAPPPPFPRMAARRPAGCPF
nr:vegetative cell wall protein gp1-like [Aegilops tauschii subsp. strangulata]